MLKRAWRVFSFVLVPNLRHDGGTSLIWHTTFSLQRQRSNDGRSLARGSDFKPPAQLSDASLHTRDSYSDSGVVDELVE